MVFRNSSIPSIRISPNRTKDVPGIGFQNNYQESYRLAELKKLFDVKNNFPLSTIFGAVRLWVRNKKESFISKHTVRIAYRDS